MQFWKCGPGLVVTHLKGVWVDESETLARGRGERKRRERGQVAKTTEFRV